MTNDTPSADTTRTEIDYHPEEDHFCDGNIAYEDNVTIPLTAGADTHTDSIVTVPAHCTVCGRDLMIVLDIAPDWLKTIDKTTGVTLHNY